MDSFLGLFNPNIPDIDVEQSDYDDQFSLPPEPQVGNIEYKLKIVNPTKQRFEHLVTQMKWRLREGQGEALYEIGVEDNGVLTGLSESDMNDSLSTLQRMANVLGAATTILRERTLENGRMVTEVLVRKVPDDQNNIDVRIAVIGSADAGKSTLLGVLTQGNLDNGRGRARLNMFRHLHEVKSGRTSSISHEFIGFDVDGQVINYNSGDLMTAEEICVNSTKLVTFLDLAGHRKYLRTTIQGLSGYFPHYAMLVISSTSGIVSMTHEHLNIAIALEVPFFVVISKTDLVSSEVTARSLEKVLKSSSVRRVPLFVKNEDDVITAGANGLAENVIPVFCLSSVNGNGLQLLLKFLHVLPPNVSTKEKERLEEEPCEFQIDETFLVSDVGQVMGGLLTKGVIREGSKLSIGPMNDGSFKPVCVQSIHRNKVPCRVVRAGQSAAISLNCKIPNLRRGMVLLQPGIPTTACYFFQATVFVLYHATVIQPGFQTTIYIGSIRQTAVIEGIMATGGIHTNESSSVLCRFVSHPEYLQVGSRLLFKEGESRGIGKITQVFPYSLPKQKFMIESEG